MLNMARMYPQQLPAAVLHDNKKFSEVKVYEQLKRLSRRICCFSQHCLAGSQQDHSETGRYRARLDAPPRKVYPRGEADFIVLHPRKGILVLEVKGGRLKLDGGARRAATAITVGMTYIIR